MNTSTSQIQASNHLHSHCSCIADNDFTEVKVMLDMSFKERVLVRCNKCKQHYIREYESVLDWKTGNEWFETTFIPLRNDFKLLEIIKQPTSHSQNVYDLAV